MEIPSKYTSKNGEQYIILSSAVWVLLKVDEDDLEIMSGSLDQVKKSNLF